MAHDTVVQWRLSAEPRTPFLCRCIVEICSQGRLQSQTWLFWLCDYSMLPSLSLPLFLLFLEGKDIIIQPHLFNCSNWSHIKWALPFICNGHDYEIVFHAEQSSPISTNEVDVRVWQTTSYIHLFAGLNLYLPSGACGAICPRSTHVTASFELWGWLDLRNGGLE